MMILKSELLWYYGRNVKESSWLKVWIEESLYVKFLWKRIRFEAFVI